MERLIREDFAVHGDNSLNLVPQTSADCEFSDDDDDIDRNIDLDFWNTKIFEFNEACSVNNAEQIVIILNELNSKLETKDDLIAPFLDPIEQSDFFNYSNYCFSTKNEEIIYSFIRFISCMAYVSSDFVKSICTNGVLNQIVSIFCKQMQSNSPYSILVIKPFFDMVGIIGQDKPCWLFQLVQLGIISLCEKVLLTYSDNIDIIKSVIGCLEIMFSNFNDVETKQAFPCPQVSSLFQTLKILITSLIIERESNIETDQIYSERATSKDSIENTKKKSNNLESIKNGVDHIESKSQDVQTNEKDIDQIVAETFTDQNNDIFDGVLSGRIGYFFDKSFPIENRKKLIRSCFGVFSNFINSPVTVTILLNSTVPQFCYEILDSQFPMIDEDDYLRSEILCRTTEVLKYVFRFSPGQPIQQFIDNQIDIRVLSMYIDLDMPEITINILSVIGYILYFSKSAIFDAIECDIFDKIFQLYNDADFKVKSTIFHVIAAGINNGDSNIVTSLFLNTDIIDILTDAIETNIPDFKDEIPTALKNLAHIACTSGDDIYSIILPIIEEIQI